MRAHRIVLALLLAAAPARPDEIVLDSGGVLSCEILEEAADYVRVRMPSGTMTVERRRIRTIRREKTSRYLLREARDRAGPDQTAAAVRLYERAAAADPDDGDAREGLVSALDAHARAMVRQWRFRAAEEALARLHRLSPDHPAPAAPLPGCRVSR
jgi:hypothetical protein